MCNLFRCRRGSVALEMPAVMLLVMLSFIVPLADFSIFGYKFISAFQALRDAGQYMQYHPPTDITTTYTLPSYVATQISNVQVLCGDAGLPCSSTNNQTPKYYTFQTSFTLSPTPLMRPVLCVSANANKCQYTLSYSERFQ
jgi:hypothetical protein